MDFPTQALNPAGDVVSILVDADGRVVTDQSPKPATTYPATDRSIRVDASGNLLTT